MLWMIQTDSIDRFRREVARAIRSETGLSVAQEKSALPFSEINPHKSFVISSRRVLPSLGFLWAVKPLTASWVRGD